MKTILSSVILICFFAYSPRPAAALPQEEDDLRRIWNKKFIEARQKNERVAAKGRAGSGAKTGKPMPSQSTLTTAAALQKLPGDLVGVTLWRLAENNPQNRKDLPLIQVRQANGNVNSLIAERVFADTAFTPNQLVRIGIEVPREKQGYLYVIDREVYADGSMSEPYLIFPSRSTPAGGNQVAAGRIIYVPAQGDPNPYFHIQRNRADQVSELLTIIVTPTPLNVRPGPPDAPAELDATMVARWEQKWGGRTERRELAGGAGLAWTRIEKEAGEGRRKLVQSDPLPQTVYFVAGNRGDHTLVQVPLKIAR
jgi:hypothetical protein